MKECERITDHVNNSGRKTCRPTSIHACDQQWACLPLRVFVCQPSFSAHTNRISVAVSQPRTRTQEKPMLGAEGLPATHKNECIMGILLYNNKPSGSTLTGRTVSTSVHAALLDGLLQSISAMATPVATTTAPSVPTATHCLCRHPAATTARATDADAASGPHLQCRHSVQ